MFDELFPLNFYAISFKWSFLLVIFVQIASEGLKSRVFEVSLADLQGDEDHAYRKIRLRSEDVQGKNVLTNFWVWSIWEKLVFLEFCFCAIWSWWVLYGSVHSLLDL